MTPSGGKHDERTQAVEPGGHHNGKRLTPGRCPLWGRRTPDAPGSTPGRLACRKDSHQ